MRSNKSKRCRSCCPSAPGASASAMMRDTGVRLRLTSINTQALILPTAFVHSAWRSCMPNGSTRDLHLKLHPRRPDICRAVATGQHQLIRHGLGWLISLYVTLWVSSRTTYVNSSATFGAVESTGTRAIRAIVSLNPGRFSNGFPESVIFKDCFKVVQNCETFQITQPVRLAFFGHFLINFTSAGIIWQKAIQIINQILNSLNNFGVYVGCRFLLV